MCSWLLLDADAKASVPPKAGPPRNLVLDLTSRDVPAAARRRQVAETVSAWRAASPSLRLWILIDSLEHGLAEVDLAAIVPAAPDGVILSGCASARDLQHLGSKLGVAEAQAGLADGTTGIVALIGARADALFAMAGFAGSSRRLAGLAWDGAGLAATLGLEAGGSTLPGPLALGRALIVVAAHAAGVPAIDTGFGLTGEHLARACRRARQDGFAAMMTRDSAQAGVIETAFSEASGMRSDP